MWDISKLKDIVVPTVRNWDNIFDNIHALFNKIQLDLRLFHKVSVKMESLEKF